MNMLVTGGDTELGRTVAAKFADAGHAVTLAGMRGPELTLAAQEIATEVDVNAVACDTADPASLAAARSLFPHHLDAIVTVPAPRWHGGDLRAHSLADHAAAWRSELDATVLAAVLTVATLGDHLRSGGSIVSVVPTNPRAGSAEAAVKAALSNWAAGQATTFGTRGITVNVVAAGDAVRPGYDGLTGDGISGTAEIARLALFLTTPSARHITGQTLHVSQGALADFG